MMTPRSCGHEDRQEKSNAKPTLLSCLPFGFSNGQRNDWGKAVAIPYNVQHVYMA